MSRRSRTTLTLSVRMPLPPGATQKDALEFLRHALEDKQALGASLAPAAPLSSLQVNEVQVKIINRETVYL